MSLNITATEEGQAEMPWVRVAAEDLKRTILILEIKFFGDRKTGLGGFELGRE